MEDSIISSSLWSSIFTLVFLDGYSFRHMFDYLKSCESTCDVVMSADYIRISQCELSQAMLNIIEINVADLLEYYFYAVTPEITFRINIADINGIAKSIGKKEGLRIYKLENSNELRFQISNQSNFSTHLSINDFGTIKVQEVLGGIVYTEPTYIRTERDANVKVQTARFTKICKSISQVKSTNIRVIIYEEGIKFESKSDGDITAITDQIGICNNELMVFVINSSLFKNLNKISNLVNNNNSIVKFYIEENKPLKLIVPISMYGRLKVYLRPVSI